MWFGVVPMVSLPWLSHEPELISVQKPVPFSPPPVS
jgi:hypothetical protein